MDAELDQSAGDSRSRIDDVLNPTDEAVGVVWSQVVAPLAGETEGKARRVPPRTERAQR